MAETVETAIYRLQIEGQEQLDKMKTSVDGLAVSEEKATASTRTYSDALQNSIARMDPLIRAQQQYQKALEQNERYRETGVGSEAQLSAQLEAATAKYLAQKAAIEGLGGAHKGLDGQAQAAMHSMRSLIESIASGAPITQALTQQFGHLSYAASGEGGISGAFKQVGSFVTSMITPTTAAIAAVTALGAAALYAANQFDKLQVSSQRAISGAGARTGTTVEDINKFVSQTSSGFGGAGLSDKEARDLAESFTKTGDIVISRLHDMGTAVVGFANQSGQSITEASAAMVKFAQDPLKAMDELAKTFGAFDVPTRKAVEALVQADDKTGAFQTIIDSLSVKLKDAAGNTTALESATRRLITAMGSQPAGPKGIDTQIAATKKALDEAISSASDMIDTEGASKNIELLTNKLIELQAAAEKVHIAQVSAELNKLSTDADAATRSLTPQIDQIKKLEIAIGELERAKAAGVTSQYGGAADDAALTAAQNQLQALKDSQAEAARLNDIIAGLRDKWQGVSAEVAKQLQTMQNNLPVAQAVGGAAKMAAQETADYANYMLQGKTATEAAALAAANHAAAQAQVNSAAKETLWDLQNQAESAGAVTGAEKMAADAQGTYNKLVHDGVDATTAEAVAAQQLANAQAAATANVQRQTMAVKDQTDMIVAQARGMGDAEAAAQAYRHAVDSGADSTAAAALQAAMLAQSWTKAALAAQQAVGYAAALNAGMSALLPMGLGGNMGQEPGSFGSTPSGRMGQAWEAGGGSSVTILQAAGINLDKLNANLAAGNISYQDQINNAAAAGGIGAALALAQGTTAHAASSSPGVWIPGQGFVAGGTQTSQAVSNSDIISAVDQLYQVMNQQTSDKGTQAANMQAELTWLKSQPESLAKEQQIASLQQSLDQLKTSTDNLNATNQDLLSPYYTQDPRTSHIGFRSQGMAAGGYVDVPGGSSSNDNMLLTMPVASGERVYVDPMTGTRGTGGSNLTINISSPVLIQGNANKDDVGRTMFQNNQNLAKQLRQAAQ